MAVRGRPDEEGLRLAGGNGDALQAVLFRPPREEGEGALPGVLLIHDVYGLDEARAPARRLAAEGFATLVVDLDSRADLPGPPPSAGPPGERDGPAPAWNPEEIRAAVQALPDRRALADLEAGLAALGERPEVDARSIAAVGFGLGGTLAFLLGCTSMRLAAVVAFDGGPLYAELSANKPIQPLELALNLDRPLLAFFAGKDPLVAPESVQLLRETLTAAAKDFEIVSYPEAGHGFFNDRRSPYHGASAEDAWERTLGFLRDVL